MVYKFTFHNVSIKSKETLQTLIGGLDIYIPQCLY